MPEEQPREADHNWLCPWCGKIAHLPTRHTVICYSKTCACGARALGAPPWDSDEIVDDAINIFGIADGFMTSFDADRLAGLQKVGVEIKEGQTIPHGESGPFEIRVLWFRRGPGEAT